MKSKRIVQYVLVLFCCGFIIPQATEAQGTVPPAVVQTLQSVYRNYDSIKYLSFDVKFNYGSDTLLGKFDNEEMDGSYSLAGNKALYRLGDIDFMQNDSFFIAVYNKDKLIMVDEPKVINMGSQLPMRQQIDSLLSVYAVHYNISMYSLGDTGVIQLTGIDSLAQFSRFTMHYDNRNYMLYQLSYGYKEPADLSAEVLQSYQSSTGTTDIPEQQKRFTIRFMNYRYENYEEGAFQESRYIWFEKGVCKPASGYSDFKIYYIKPAVHFYEQQ